MNEDDTPVTEVDETTEQISSYKTTYMGDYWNAIAIYVAIYALILSIVYLTTILAEAL